MCNCGWCFSVILKDRSCKVCQKGSLLLWNVAIHVSSELISVSLLCNICIFLVVWLFSSCWVLQTSEFGLSFFSVILYIYLSSETNIVDKWLYHLIGSNYLSQASMHDWLLSDKKMNEKWRWVFDAHTFSQYFNLRFRKL